MLRPRSTDVRSGATPPSLPEPCGRSVPACPSVCCPASR